MPARLTRLLKPCAAICPQRFVYISGAKQIAPLAAQLHDQPNEHLLVGLQSESFLQLDITKNKLSKLLKAFGRRLVDNR